MDKWAKIELMRNLNKIGEPDVIEDNGHGFHMTIRFYGMKTAVKDTFKFRNKNNLFRAGHNFFCKNIDFKPEFSMGTENTFEYGYVTNSNKTIERNYIGIKIICKLKKVSR